METRKPYPTDVSDEEWAFVAPYLTLMTPDAPQRDHSLRDVFNALRWIVRAGAPWRLLPHEFPPWHAVCDQTQRWLKAGSFEAIVHDLRELLRVAQRRDAREESVQDRHHEGGLGPPNRVKPKHCLFQKRSQSPARDQTIATSGDWSRGDAGFRVATITL